MEEMCGQGRAEGQRVKKKKKKRIESQGHLTLRCPPSACPTDKPQPRLHFCACPLGSLRASLFVCHSNLHYLHSSMYSPSRPTSTSPSTPSSASQRPSAAHGHSQQQQQHSHPRSRSHSQSYPHPQGQSNSTSSMPEALRQAPPPPMLHPLERHAPQQPTVQQQQITTPFLNSINRVSRTYYSKQEQAIIYQARNPAVHVQRQSDMRRESCEVIAAIGKRIGLYVLQDVVIIEDPLSCSIGYWILMEALVACTCFFLLVLNIRSVPRNYFCIDSTCSTLYRILETRYGYHGTGRQG